MIRKRSQYRRSPAALALLIACISACGSVDPEATAGETATATGPLLPWKAGHTWTYRVTDGLDISSKVTKIGALERVGGTGPNADKMAHKVVTTKRGGTDQTVSWQVQVGDSVVRYREQAFSASTGMMEGEEHWMPHKLHIDGAPAHTTKGAQWLESYQETKLPVGGQPATNETRDLWTIAAVNEQVVVPAGPFRAIVIQKAGGGSAKTYWYVPGVGKVKETGGQVEELESYELAP